MTILTRRLLAVTPMLALGVILLAPRPRLIRGEIHIAPVSLLTGQEQQLCRFNVYSDSSRKLAPDQVGIPTCDSLALIYTRAAMPKGGSK